MGTKRERRRAKKLDSDVASNNADNGVGHIHETSNELAQIEDALEASGMMGGDTPRMRKKSLPWQSLSEPEKRWRIIERVNYLFDLANAAFFVYVGFIHFADDDVMDPLAWQLAWGSAAILALMKIFLVYTNAIGFFPLFAAFEIALCLGHIYGAIRYFLWLEDQEFNCFSGTTRKLTDKSKPRYYDTGYCYNGELLICTAWTAAYTAGSVVFMWLWSRFYKKISSERGDVRDVDITELLTQVDSVSSLYVKRIKRDRRDSIL